MCLKIILKFISKNRTAYSVYYIRVTQKRKIWQDYVTVVMEFDCVI
jgi:hypothetical protein